MSRALLIAASPGELWAALTEADELVELRIARGGGGPRIGEILLGRIVRLDPALPAALVEIGLERPGFLSAEDAVPGHGIAGLVEGQAVIVQVTKDARADKAAGITLRPRLGGAYLDLVPGRRSAVTGRGLDAAARARLLADLAAIARPDEGFHIRDEARAAGAAALAADAAALRARWQAIADERGRVHPPARLEPEAKPVTELLAALLAPEPDRIVIDDRAVFAEARGWLQRHHAGLVPRLAHHGERTPLFEHEGVAAAIEAALAARVALHGGGALTIETTAAAVMIDVDSGGAPLLATNLAAARAAARHIRLRNLAGPIVIDFIAMRHHTDRDRVHKALAQALAGDPAEPQLLGWTRLGHMELARKRRHAALDELLFEPGPEGGRVKTALTVALEALRALDRAASQAPARPLALRVAPEVAAELRDGAARGARLGLEARLGRPLMVVAEPARARAAFDIGPADPI